MADATERRAIQGLAMGKGESGSVKALVSTVELAASASGTTIDVGYIPSNARITGASTMYWDDLATSGSPTIDIGLIAVNSNITSDPGALNDGSALSSASTGTKVVKDAANYGLPAWDHVNGQTTDPGGVFLVQAVVKDAATTTTGTVTFELYYTLD